VSTQHYTALPTTHCTALHSVLGLAAGHGLNYGLGNIV
jgi:hypothetical protein